MWRRRLGAPRIWAPLGELPTPAGPERGRRLVAQMAQMAQMQFRASGPLRSVALQWISAAGTDGTDNYYKSYGERKRRGGREGTTTTVDCFPLHGEGVRLLGTSSVPREKSLRSIALHGISVAQMVWHTSVPAPPSRVCKPAAPTPRRTTPPGGTWLAQLWQPRQTGSTSVPVKSVNK